MINKQIQHTRGFTLLETLVAILILTMAIAAPLLIAQKDADTTLVSKDQITAYYLAQDAIEYVRFVSDSDALAGTSRAAGLDTNSNGHTTHTGASCLSSDGSAKCIVDSFNDDISSCTGGVCPAMTYYTDIGYYSYPAFVAPGESFGVPSIFTRSISIQTPVGPNPAEGKVTVTVSWQDNANITRHIQVQEDLFAWQ